LWNDKYWKHEWFGNIMAEQRRDPDKLPRDCPGTRRASLGCQPSRRRCVYDANRWEAARDEPGRRATAIMKKMETSLNRARLVGLSLGLLAFNSVFSSWQRKRDG
jgi:hypothetical protein